MGDAPVLLLHHVGRKSGERRVTPVLFLADGTRIIIVGSKGGASSNPAWLHNLRANPFTSVEVANRVFQVRARDASDVERVDETGRVADDLGKARRVRRHDGRPDRHRLQWRVAEPLIE